jgi:hypothetical protein
VSIFSPDLQNLTMRELRLGREILTKQWRDIYQAPEALCRRNRRPGMLIGAQRSAIQSAGGLQADYRDLLAEFVAEQKAKGAPEE